MTNLLHTVIGVYVATGLLTVLTIIATMLIHAGIRRLENAVSHRLPPEQAKPINELLDLIDHLAAAAVHDANNRLVNQLKQQGRFSPETAASVKEAVVSDIMQNLGPLQASATDLLPELAEIIGESIEKHVEKSKQTVS